MFETVDDILEHFGVKGMQWGVRKDRKAAAEGFAKASEKAGANQDRQRLNTTLTESSFRKLSDRDTVIEKGSLVKRVTKTPNSESSSDRLYVSTNEQDATNYRAIIPTWSTKTGVTANRYSDHYEVTLQATRALKSPSEKKRVEAYIKLMDEPVVRLASGEQITGRQYLERSGLGETISHLSNREVALTYYGQLASQQGMRNEPLSSAYFREMSSRGYNALIDDNDRGVYSNTPVLALNATTDLNTIQVQRLTDSDIRTAQQSLRVPD